MNSHQGKHQWKHILGELLGRQILRLEVASVDSLMGFMISNVLMIFVAPIDPQYASTSVLVLTQFTKYATERNPLTSRDSIPVTLVLMAGMQAALVSQPKLNRKGMMSFMMKDWQKSTRACEMEDDVTRRWRVGRREMEEEEVERQRELEDYIRAIAHASSDINGIMLGFCLISFLGHPQARRTIQVTRTSLANNAFFMFMFSILLYSVLLLL